MTTGRHPLDAHQGEQFDEAEARSRPPHRYGDDNSLDDGGSNGDGVVVSIQGVGEATMVEEVQFVEMTRGKKKMMEGEKFRVYMQ